MLFCCTLFKKNRESSYMSGETVNVCIVLKTGIFCHVKGLARCDIIFFPKIKIKMKDHHFDTLEQILYALQR